MKHRAIQSLLATLPLWFLPLTSHAETIFACRLNTLGTIRLVPPNTSCTRYETLISWNTTGTQGQQGPEGPQGPPGPQGIPGTMDPSVLRQINTLQAQLDTLRNAVVADANGVAELRSEQDRQDLIGGDSTTAVGSNRTVSIGAIDSTTIGGNASTTVGGTMQLAVGNGILIQSGSSTVQINPNGSITVNGSSIALRATGNLLLEAGGTLTMRAAVINQN